MFRLLRYFSIASLISMVLAAIVLGVLHWTLEKSHLLELGESHNIVLTQAFTNIIWPPYRKFADSAIKLDTDTLRRNPNIARLDLAVREGMRNTTIVRLKVYQLDGHIIFSTDPDEIGNDYSGKAGFIAARNGSVFSEIERQDNFKDMNGRVLNGHTLSSYIALRRGPGDPIEGVLEIYSDITDEMASDIREEQLITLTFVGVFAALYTILFLIVKRADSVIRNQHEEQLRTEQSLRYVTTHDALTSLPNRLLLLDRINQSLTSAERHNNLLAVAYIDLDNFQNINNSLGHETGDKVLQIVAQRLSQCLREGDTIARIGGDVFVVSLPDIHSNVNLFQIAKKMLAAISVPITSEQREFHLTASIGIALYPEHGRDAETLLRKADMAMHSAKRLGRNRHQMFVEHMDEQVQQQVQLEDEMWRALKNNEFVLYYQPVIDLNSGAIIGAEALLRWPNPHGAWLSPAEFVPLTEKCGLIVPLSEWVLSESCAQLQTWRESGLGMNDFTMAVNLSPRHFETAGLATMIADVIEQAQIDPRWLHLEITEGLLMGKNETVLTNFDGLKRIGIKFSLDDFGTGYSSLGYLRSFPIDLLKIDRTFVHDLPGNADNAAIVATIIALANSLDLAVVAKGIETDTQVSFLRQLGCQYAQGFLFSRPLPPDEFLSLVAEQRDMRFTQSVIQLHPPQ